ncbi:unnamed protein product [Rhizophagus irregularis]|nr:unnamed protein product [Rhizophagus irregularis]
MSLFDEASNVLIREYMDLYKDKHNKFVLISKMIPKYKPNQLSNCWHNYINPHYPKNKVRNFWNSKKKSDERRAKRQLRMIEKRKITKPPSDNLISDQPTLPITEPKVLMEPKILTEPKILMEPKVLMEPKILMEPKVSFNDFNMPLKMVPLF